MGKVLKEDKKFKKGKLRDRIIMSKVLPMGVAVAGCLLSLGGYINLISMGNQPMLDEMLIDNPNVNMSECYEFVGENFAKGENTSLEKTLEEWAKVTNNKDIQKTLDEYDEKNKQWIIEALKSLGIMVAGVSTTLTVSDVLDNIGKKKRKEFEENQKELEPEM